jgi:hypothetical protein
MRSLVLKQWKVYLLAGAVFMLLRWMEHLTDHRETVEPRVLNDMWRLLLVVVLHFLFFEKAIPYLTTKKSSIILNIIAAVPMFFVFLMSYSWGVYLWRLLGVAIGIYTPLAVYKTPEHAATEQFTYSIMTMFLFGVVRHIYHYIRLKQVAQQLRIEKQAAELNYLKSQTNPHFLFNTLNNIYALSQEKSDLAPESILRLSKILRYMLYETSGQYIAIEQELKIINDYIELEKLRYDDSLRINYNYNIEDMKQAIPPLLLMPLVENAFKHGVSETRSRPFIDIHLSVKNRQLTFVVKNSSETTIAEVKENIGLSNLRRQLQLLYKQHNLLATQDASTFTATLNINLVSHV